MMDRPNASRLVAAVPLTAIAWATETTGRWPKFCALFAVAITRPASAGSDMITSAISRVLTFSR
jgi:hypothetical protein